MAGVGDRSEPGDIALCVDSALLGNRRYILGELVEIEYANVVPV